MADVTQQLRVNADESISGRMDMLNSINTALQNVSAKPTASKPYRISDLLPRNWESSNEEKDNPEASCQTCTCGCKRGQTKEKNACQR